MASATLTADFKIELHERIISTHFFTQELNSAKGECSVCNEFSESFGKVEFK